jgi:hypothetical protein
MVSNLEIRVAIDGAPCAGKSRVSERAERVLCRLGLLRSDDVDIFFWEEAWERFAPFANLLFQLFKENGSLTPELMTKIKAEMAETDVGSIVSSINSTPERVFKTEVQENGQVYYWNYFTVLDIYEQFGCNFLEKATEVVTIGELRELIQANMLIVQADRESRIQPRDEEYFGDMRQIHVCDGSLFSIINYWQDMSFQDYQKATGLQVLFEAQQLALLTQSYEVVIVLETLTNLAAEEYEQYFFDGRRLDTPEDARQLHTRIVELVKDHPCHFVIPAGLSESKKVKIVVIILNELRKILLANEELSVLKERVLAQFTEDYFIPV